MPWLALTTCIYFAAIVPSNRAISRLQMSEGGADERADFEC